MAGLYIHIPFCKTRCIYCGFFSTTELELRQRYVDAVCREVSIRETDCLIDTIYLGGGTPSQLSIGQLKQIFDSLYIYNKVEKEAEITIEANPDDVTDDFAHGLAHLPVNRVSMGVQTFSNERLRFLHRRHTILQVANAIKSLRMAGIRNISIDLMYGFPGETLTEWEADIDAAIALNVEHISAYCLMVEEGTVLYEIMRNGENGEMRDCDEETERRMYELLIDKLETAGYEHYEISNFARPGYRSRHNSCYWNGTPYIGIGAGAHSYDIRTRSWNISDIRRYIDAIERGERPFEDEVIDDQTRYNDTVTVALRTREGIDLRGLPDSFRDYCLQNAGKFVDDGLLKMNGYLLSLTRKGLFVSDMIMSDLMWVD